MIILGVTIFLMRGLIRNVSKVIPQFSSFYRLRHSCAHGNLTKGKYLLLSRVCWMLGSYAPLNSVCFFFPWKVVFLFYFSSQLCNCLKRVEK